MSKQHIATGGRERNQRRILIDMGYSPELTEALLRSPVTLVGIFAVRDRQRTRSSSITRLAIASADSIIGIGRALPYSEVGYSEAMAEYREKQAKAIKRMHELRALRLQFHEKPAVYLRRSRRLRFEQQQRARLMAAARSLLLRAVANCHQHNETRFAEAA